MIKDKTTIESDGIVMKIEGGILSINAELDFHHYKDGLIINGITISQFQLETLIKFLKP